MSEDAGAPPTQPEPLTDDARLHRRSVFDQDAALYAARRPTYPEPLFKALQRYADLNDGSRVLEVAPGTGQATRPLGLRGYHITAVELGAQMASHARRHVADLPNVSIETAAFEDWPLPPAPFDALFCATAWHWLDPTQRLLKAHRALRPGGTLAVVWTHYVAGGTNAFFDDLARLYADAGSPGAWTARRAAEQDLPTFTVEAEESSQFTDVVAHRFPVTITYDRDAYVELARTYSETVALPAPALNRVLAEVGQLIDTRYDGQVTAQYVFELVLARAAASRQEDLRGAGQRRSAARCRQATNP